MSGCCWVFRVCHFWWFALEKSFFTVRLPSSPSLRPVNRIRNLHLHAIKFVFIRFEIAHFYTKKLYFYIEMIFWSDECSKWMAVWAFFGKNLKRLPSFRYNNTSICCQHKKSSEYLMKSALHRCTKSGDAHTKNAGIHFLLNRVTVSHFTDERILLRWRLNSFHVRAFASLMVFCHFFVSRVHVLDAIITYFLRLSVLPQAKVYF